MPDLLDQVHSGQSGPPPDLLDQLHAARTKPDQVDTGETFLGELGKGAKGALDSLMLIANAVKHPAGSFPAVQQALKDQFDASAAQLSKAKEAYTQGKHSEALGHLFGATPGIGPVAAAAGEAIGGTDPTLDKTGNVIESGKAPNLGAGLGKAAVALAPIVAGPAAGAARDAASKVGGAIKGAIPDVGIGDLASAGKVVFKAKTGNLVGAAADAKALMDRIAAKKAGVAPPTPTEPATGQVSPIEFQNGKVRPVTPRERLRQQLQQMQPSSATPPPDFESIAPPPRPEKVSPAPAPPPASAPVAAEPAAAPPPYEPASPLGGLSEPIVAEMRNAAAFLKSHRGLSLNSPQYAEWKASQRVAPAGPAPVDASAPNGTLGSVGTSLEDQLRASVADPKARPPKSAETGKPGEFAAKQRDIFVGKAREIKAKKMVDLLQRWNITDDRVSLMNDAQWKDLEKAAGVTPGSAETRALVVEALR